MEKNSSTPFQFFADDLIHVLTDTDSSTQPARIRVGEECYHNFCWHAGLCRWCGAEGMCCRQGEIKNGCDGKVGGVDRYECTAEAPKGKMLTLSIRLPCNAYKLN